MPSNELCKFCKILSKRDFVAGLFVRNPSLTGAKNVNGLERLGILAGVRQVLELTAEFVKLVSDFCGHRRDASIKHSETGIKGVRDTCQMGKLVGSLGEIALQRIDFVAERSEIRDRCFRLSVEESHGLS
ncbi:MAG: hypothetical protein ACO39X_06775 [Candidatus Nanopelagicaceae bacterium]